MARFLGFTSWLNAGSKLVCEATTVKFAHNVRLDLRRLDVAPGYLELMSAGWSGERRAAVVYSSESVVCQQHVIYVAR